VLLSQWLAFLLPLYLGLYWPFYLYYQSVAIVLFRPAVLGTCVALYVFSWYRVPLTHAEKRLAAMLAILCVALLAPSVAAVDPARALEQWLKLFILCVISFFICRALRHERTARVFGASLILASLVTGLLVVATYVRFMGLLAPTYTATRVFKGVIAREGIPLNPIAFDCIFAFVCGMCLVRRSKLYWPLGLLLLVLSSVLTGSRAPLATFAVSGLALVIINALRSRRLLAWTTGGLLLVGLVVGALVAIPTLSSRDLSAFTEGRWELWSTAFQNFSQHPLLGSGYLSAQDYFTFAGGYHSEYLTALAEQGIVGLVALLGLFWFLLSRGWKLAFRRFQTWGNGQWALLGCLLLIVRAAIEVDGLFGLAQEPGDFLAYIFLAIVVSRFSQEEDYVAAVSEATLPSPVTLVRRGNFAPDSLETTPA
jgi:O-antigen ligase